MSRGLLATGDPSDDLTLLKYGYAVVCFVATLLAGAATHKMLTWKGEKMTPVVSSFAAGVCLGTATIDLLTNADHAFHWLGRNYPVAFLLSCTGYLVAMLADCLLVVAVRRVGRECFRKCTPNLLDKIMLFLIYDLHPTKCCDFTLPVGTSKSDIKECDGIGYLRYHILYRATVLGDSIVLMLTFGFLSMDGGDNMWKAETKTMAWTAFLIATLYNITYAVSLVITLLRSAHSLPFSRCFLFVFFTTATPYSFVYSLVLSENDSIFGASSVSNAWLVGIYAGFFSGVFVYMAVHHLLADDYKLKMKISKSCLFKFAAMVCGVGMIALLKTEAM